jgi:hypothetical protein
MLFAGVLSHQIPDFAANSSRFVVNIYKIVLHIHPCLPDCTSAQTTESIPQKYKYPLNIVAVSL